MALYYSKGHILPHCFDKFAVTNESAEDQKCSPFSLPENESSSIEEEEEEAMEEEEEDSSPRRN